MKIRAASFLAGLAAAKGDPFLVTQYVNALLGEMPSMPKENN